MEQMLLTKESTTKGWKSFVTSQNVAYKNMKSVSEEFTDNINKGKATTTDQLVDLLTRFKNDILAESKKADDDVESLLKQQDLDRDFVSFLNRALTNSKSDEQKSSDFIDKIVALVKSDMDPQQKGTQMNQQSIEFAAMQQRIAERSVNEAEGIGKILADRYSQSFDLNDLQVYVDYNKEKEKNKQGDKTPKSTETGTQVPVDPGNGGGANREQVNPPADGAAGNTRNTNTTEVNASMLTGQWQALDGTSTLELSSNGKMFWVFSGRGYTSGDWALANGKIEMHATNPDTKQTYYLNGNITNLTANALTLSFPGGTMQGVYSFSKKQ
jgi:hypothetical protein